MRIKHSFSTAVAVAVAAVMFSASMQVVEASFVLTAEQVGANVVVYGTGLINTESGISGTATIQWSARVDGVQLGTGLPDNAAAAFFLTSVTGPVTVSNLPENIGFSANSATGNLFSFNKDGLMLLASGYTSGTPFTNSATWNNKNMADWGWPTNGTWASPSNIGTWTLSTGDTVTIQAVPEPSTCVMALAGLACGGYSLFRRRKQA